MPEGANKDGTFDVPPLMEMYKNIFILYLFNRIQFRSLKARMITTLSLSFTLICPFLYPNKINVHYINSTCILKNTSQEGTIFPEAEKVYAFMYVHMNMHTYV